MSAATITSTRLIVGMEIHVELATQSKMFTAAANIAHPDHDGAAPNTLVDELVLGLPGTLPVMNEHAIEMSMRLGLALNCTIPDICKWDRKNYFYPDLPKGYQISQYDEPLCINGWLEIPAANGDTKTIRINRAHLEEDAGKLTHDDVTGDSLVNLNRAGTPLLEIVTEPDFSSADEAETFARELRNICCFLNITEGIMQRGHMRFEPNINLALMLDDGEEVRTPIVEIKNLNSFRSLRSAIEHEQSRQLEQWRSDGAVMGPGEKTTRGWDADREVTFLQRSKEDAHDYRYFPDPDLLPLVVDDAWRDRVRATLPELPAARRARYERDYGLNDKESRALTDDREACLFYEACIAETAAATALDDAAAGLRCAKLLLNIGAQLANDRETTIDALGIAPPQVAQVIAMREAGDIGSSAADTLFARLCETDADATTVAAEAGLLQVRDAGQLEVWINEAIAAEPGSAADFAAGKDAALGRLTGAVMRASKGQADARQVQNRLRERLRA